MGFLVDQLRPQLIELFVCEHGHQQTSHCQDALDIKGYLRFGWSCALALPASSRVILERLKRFSYAPLPHPVEPPQATPTAHTSTLLV